MLLLLFARGAAKGEGADTSEFIHIISLQDRILNSKKEITYLQIQNWLYRQETDASRECVKIRTLYVTSRKKS